MKLNLLKLNLIVLLSILYSNLSNAQCTFGNYPPPYTTPASFGANYLLGSRYTLASTGTLTGLAYNGNGTGANMQMAIYSDMSGVVGSLFATSSLTTVATGNTTLSIGTPIVIPAGNYWIMAVYNGGSGNNHVNFSSSVTTTVSYISWTCGTPPPTTASWITYPNQDFNYWAVLAGTPSTVSINSSTTTVCSGSTVSLVANGASSYLWNTGATSTTITPSPTTTTTYSVTGNTGCSNTAVQTISVNALPIITISGPSSVCAGSTASITASGPSITYSWSTGATGSNIVVTPSVNSTYTVGGIDMNGCINTAVKSVTVSTLPTLSVSSSNTLLCVGQTSTLTVNGASTYSWSTGSNSVSIIVTPSVSTGYSVVATGTNGCTNSTSFTQSVSACTGIAQFQNAGNEIKAYPNPTRGNVSLELPGETSLTIYNCLGEIILNETVQQGNYNINLSDKANGVYMIRANSGNSISTIKIIKN